MTGVPAFVRNARFDVVAANALGRALYAPLFDSPLFAQRGPVNSARFLFLDPAAQDFWAARDKGADDAVAFLRTETGRAPHDRAAIIGPRTMDQLEAFLPAADVTLPADVLDAIDGIVAPGVTVNPVDNSYGDFELRADQRRR
ncbi:MmyB family transcriptional regulator [Streptomyces sp. NPDC002125]